MTHKYSISGMSCDGCRFKVEKALNTIDDVEAIVSLDLPIATITMKKPIQTTQFQEVLSTVGTYTITVFNPNDLKLKQEEVVPVLFPKNAQGKYYCPMFCEGEKLYDKVGDCPICGMDLVKTPELNPIKTSYTCSIHPEIIQNEPSSCSICGMDLVPMKPVDNGENKTYNDLKKKMIIASAFLLPVFIISMISMIHNNPLEKIISISNWNWIQFVLTLPVVFYAGWMFFVRAWKSLISLIL